MMSKQPLTRKYQVDFNYGGGSHAFEYVPGHWDLQAVKNEEVLPL